MIGVAVVLWSLLTVGSHEVGGFASEAACHAAAPSVRVSPWHRCVPTASVERPDPYDPLPDDLYEPY